MEKETSGLNFNVAACTEYSKFENNDMYYKDNTTKSQFALVV